MFSAPLSICYISLGSLDSGMHLEQGYVNQPKDESYIPTKYTGYTPLQNYDVGACTTASNTGPFDSKGGPCQFFNIWAGVENNATTSACSVVWYVLSTQDIEIY